MRKNASQVDNEVVPGKIIFTTLFPAISVLSSDASEFTTLVTYGIF